MNRCTRRPLVASVCVFLIPLAALGQEILPEPGPLTLDVPAEIGDVGVGTSTTIAVQITGGTGPFEVTIVDLGPLEGGFFNRTTVPDADPTVNFIYTAPGEETGEVTFQITVVDSLGDDDTAQVTTRVTAIRQVPANLTVANILSRLDIDADGFPDNSPDTDGDGLPDNWELGGVEQDPENDRRVFFPAPSAIVPGTPPNPIFTRRAVATSALRWDTDGDGLSDFVEVFGLKFIDENGNGMLDAGLEWNDVNQDGLPSPGECPLDNAPRNADGTPDLLHNPFGLLHDFDGFIFTDPTNPDTDGDGTNDKDDAEPLINPRSFGSTGEFFVRFRVEDPDIDNDGLGNGMDMGNDLISLDGPGILDFEAVDNPENMRDLLQLFRADLLAEGIVPESVVEDLIGVDWDGNGLWSTTDVRDWSIIIDPDNAATRPPDVFFRLDPDNPDSHAFYAPQTLVNLTETFNVDPDYRPYGGRGIGLGWQDFLRPPSTTQFIPDVRIWAILYSWRLPGFDVDGDGFIGVPNLPSTAPAAHDDGAAGDGETTIASVALVRDATGAFAVLAADVPVTVPQNGDAVRNPDARPFDDRIAIAENPEPTQPGLDGVIDVQDDVANFIRSLTCGSLGGLMLVTIMLGLGLMRFSRRR